MAFVRPTPHGEMRRAVFAAACVSVDKLKRGNALVTMVRHILDVPAGKSIPSLADVANAVCLSTRTLRRRLGEAGVGYREILEDLRLRNAIAYLTTTDLTNEQIASRLGYSESANFRHAFRKWTGASPRRYAPHPRVAMHGCRPGGNAAAADPFPAAAG